MEEMLKQVTLLLSNGLATYIIYRFMHVFFEKRAVEKKTAIAVYVLQYIISAFVLVWVPYPVLNVFIALLCYGMIAWCYEGSVRKRIIVIAIIYGCGFVIEAVVFILLENADVVLAEKRHIEVFATILEECFEWFVMIILESRLKIVKKDIVPPTNFTLMAVGQIILICFLEFLIFQGVEVEDEIRILSVLVAMLFIIIILYLYASVLNITEQQVKNQIMEREKDYYHNQAEILQNNEDGLRMFRHDLKNKMLVLYELLEKNETNQAKEYLKKLTEKIEKTQNYSQSGNIVIDSVVNYKLSLAEKQGCNITVEISLPSKLMIEDDDLVIVLGNLLDNAIEATKKLATNKYIHLKIKYDRECLIVKIENSFDNQVIIKKGSLQTTKENQSLHGIGLRSVQKIINQYNGELNIKYKENIFLVIVMLYSAK